MLYHLSVEHKGERVLVVMVKQLNKNSYVFTDPDSGVEITHTVYKLRTEIATTTVDSLN